jgi:hypothetical protein
MVFYGQTIDGIPDRGYKLFITALVMVLIAAIFVAIRLATRIHLRQFGWDDLFLVIALVASVMTTIAINLGKLKDCPDLNNSQHELTFTFLAVVNGYGRHKKDMGDSIHTALMVRG